jgi:hypothetical protein
VIRWHDQYPNDWKRTWFEIQRKWSDDVGTPRLTAVEPIDFKYTTISLDNVAGSRAAAKSDTFRTVMERGVGKLWKVLTPGPRRWRGCQIIRTREGHWLV